MFIASRTATTQGNGCIRYESGNNMFFINPAHTAPGVMWFDGNINLASGFGMTTYLASRNATVNGCVTSASSGEGRPEGNEITVKLRIDLSHGTGSYDPFSIPDMSVDSNADQGGGSTMIEALSPTTMLWVKYR